MPFSRRIGPYEERSFARHAAPYCIRFTAAGVTPCTGVVQDEGLVDAGAVTRTGAGTYLVTLNQRFMRLHPGACNLANSTNGFAKVAAYVEGSAAANTFTIETWLDGGGAAADPAGGAVVDFHFRAVTSCGR